MRSSGHRVLITGGAKGIGRALAGRFHAAGNAVVIVGRDRGALERVADELAGVETVRADITTAEGRRTVGTAAGDVSVLVNNAGVQFTGEFASVGKAGAAALIARLAPSLAERIIRRS